ncbi:DNA repair protein XRCC3 homolog isoform X1 [Musa acuminata AAA Group]|uniref:DNA repair protein XRCC3 homolog isoform X1 n=1 Tax=Musa acuminata AAA Group TaxID=214697 RepID=UPI0031E0B560
MLPGIEPLNPLPLLPAQKLTLGCPVLDRLLRGGLPVGSVTEIAGESAAGKTQLCLQLLLAALLPPSRGGLSAASLFIHSEFPFPIRRLHALSSSSSAADPLDHIFVAAAHSPDDLLSLLAAVDGLLARPPTHLPVRLIVVDSIAALFRSDFDNNPKDLKKRSFLFFKIAAKLKEQARRFGSVVVVTNQVVDVVGSEEGANGQRVGNYASLWSSGRRVCPALGLSWANCVNTRLFLSRKDDVADDAGSSRTRRWMQVVFAPHLPEASCEFVIVREGVSGIEPQSRDLCVDAAGSGLQMAGIRRGFLGGAVVTDVGDLTGKFHGVKWVRRRSSTCTQVGSVVRPDPSDDQVSDGGEEFLSEIVPLLLGARGYL